jgi:dTMP kinase
LSGVLITFEGIDYSGKSLQCRLLFERLQSLQREVIQLRDPGATRISEKIRAILLDRVYLEMAPTTELLLYEAARAQMVEELIKPALAAGTIVLCDRLYDSTTAYQGFARGLDLQMVGLANRIGACGVVPAQTFLLDVDPSVAWKRKQNRGSEADRIEQEGLAFQSQVRQGYLKVAQLEPERVVVINGERDIASVAADIWQQVRSALHF